MVRHHPGIGIERARDAARNADLILYLVDASQSPEAAAYVAPEMELLGWVGKPVAYRRKSFSMREVDVRARWYEKTTKYRYSDLTRINFGGHYESTLAEFVQS